jgi:hypothetical protein
MQVPLFVEDPSNTPASFIKKATDFGKIHLICVFLWHSFDRAMLCFSVGV